MKKLTALAMAAMMAAMITPITAAEKNETKDVDTTDVEGTQDGEVWGTLSGKKLAQLKVTMPIRLDFAVVKGEGSNPNDFVKGDYKIKVASDSQTGVELTNVLIENASQGKWTLTDAAGITATSGKTTVADMKTVSLSIHGKELSYGDNAITGFTVAKANDKSLGFTGTPTKATIDESIEAKAELAFNVVYTIRQK